MNQLRWLSLWLFLLAVVFTGLVVGAGWYGDQLNVGPGLVPIWDADGRAYWISGLLLVFVAVIAYLWLERVPRRPYQTFHPPDSVTGSLPTRWILPSMVVLSTILMLGVYRGTTAIVIGALLTFIGLIVGPFARHFMDSEHQVVGDRARVVFTLLVHGVAFLSLSMIYIHKVRSIFSATAVLVVGALLLLALSEGEDGVFYQRLVYALVGGIMLGQVTWALNYWPATGWTGGAVLLVCFYLVGGMILTQFRRGVQVRDVVEYGSVSAVAFGIVVYSLFV